MLRPPSPLAAGLAEDFANQHPAWRISAQGPGAVDAFLDKLKAWKAHAPTRKLQRLLLVIGRQRQLDLQSSAWADMATPQQLERIGELLDAGADPNAIERQSGRTLVELIAKASPAAVGLLVEAGGRMTQEVLNTLSVHALLYTSDEDEARVQILKALEAEGVDYSERWQRANHAMPEFAWKPMVERALETSGLDWYRPLDLEGFTQAVPSWVARFAPITALESRQRLYSDLRRRLEAQQAARGEPVGRPPLPDMSQEALDRMIHETVTGFSGNHSYLYGDNQNTGQVLDPDERWERLGVLLARGADPNAGRIGAYTVAEQVFIHALYDEQIKLAQTLMGHGAVIGTKALVAMCEQFARHFEHARLPLEEKYLGDTQSLDPARRKKIEEADKREFDALKRTFITKLSMGEQSCGVSLDHINHGRVRDRIEALVPGITREVDLHRLLANTAQAPNTQARRTRRL